MKKELKQKIMDFTKDNGYDIDGDIITFEGRKYYVHVLFNMCIDRGPV